MEMGGAELSLGTVVKIVGIVIAIYIYIYVY